MSYLVPSELLNFDKVQALLIAFGSVLFHYTQTNQPTPQK